MNSIRDLLIEKAKARGIILDELNINRLIKYLNLLLLYNNQFNLTAITDPNEVIVKHFIDSMTAMTFIKDGSKVVDVGSGAGFPGMVIAILMPNAQITLLDSLKKRVWFLDKVVEELDLKNVKTCHLRAEDVTLAGLRESFDVGIARAVASLPSLIEYIVPYLKVNGFMIAFKGEIKGEIEESANALKELKAEITQVDQFLLDNQYKRSLVVIRKNAVTSEKYPRKGNKAKKQPL